jgi:hypothetical protein
MFLFYFVFSQKATIFKKTAFEKNEILRMREGIAAKGTENEGER